MVIASYYFLSSVVFHLDFIMANSRSNFHEEIFLRNAVSYFFDNGSATAVEYFSVSLHVINYLHGVTVSNCMRQL